MNCIFDKNKECPLDGENLESKAQFCQACTSRALVKGQTVVKATLIMGLLRMFPKDEEKAKEEYQKLMKRVEEW